MSSNLTVSAIDACRCTMIEKSLAAVILAMCLFALMRMALRPRQRERADRWARRAWWWFRDGLQRLLRRPRIRSVDAEREAREAIERAARKKTLH